MNDATILTLSEHQNDLMNRLAEHIANRASRSPLPYTEYLEGLRHFILDNTANRVKIMKMQNAAYGLMIEDERVILNILADFNKSTLGGTNVLLTILSDRVSKLL